MASQISKWFDSMKASTGGGSTSLAKVGKNPAVVAGVEGLVVGSVLGAASAHLEHGLDIQGRFPLDAALALGALFVGSSQKNEHLIAMGGQAAAIFTYRETEKLMAEMKGGAAKPAKGAKGAKPAAGATAHGEVEDRILAAARIL